MNHGRRWLALILVAFCLPLFVELGRADLDNDEAIYSFAVDRILEVGDWLTPKSSPNDDWAFLEKPPLKFWVVAAPIRLGLLPRNEFGLRFWDAVFGAAAFLYVFALGGRLAGPVCGVVAVLVLFGHWPLLIDHGLRSNGMDAALLLSYCGGVWHFLTWAGAAEPGPRRRHAMAVGGYFVLGFLTKFVAALFLPLVLGVASLIVAEYRRKLARDWQLWLGVGALVLLLCVPWFVYASIKFGSFFWQMILADHVYTRFVGYLDPMHVQPWYYYVVNLYHRLADADAGPLVIGGLIVLIIQTIKRRSADGVVLLLWLAIPLAVISASTSKVYHYIYPFLPPLALAAGYLAALIFMLASAPVGRVLDTAERYARARMPNAIAFLRRPAVRGLLLAGAVVAIGVAVFSLVFGPIRINITETAVFRSSTVLRPSLIAIAFTVLAGANRSAARVVVLLLVVGLLPLPGYSQTLARFERARHPLRTARDCLLRVQAQSASRGLQVEVPDEVLWHPINYYFRSVRPWSRADTSVPASLDESLNDPGKQRPILIWDSRYQEYRHRKDTAASPAAQRPSSPPMATFNDILLLLPGPYAECSAEAAGAGAPR